MTLILPAALTRHQPKIAVILQQGLEAACNAAKEDKFKKGVCATKSIKNKVFQAALSSREGFLLGKGWA